jgi:Arc/MetJ family transcription regulator
MRHKFCIALVAASFFLSACMSVDQLVDNAIDHALGLNEDRETFRDAFPDLVERGRDGRVDPNLDCAGLASARSSAQSSLDVARFRASQAGVLRPGQQFTRDEAREMTNDARGRVDAIDRAASQRGCLASGG